MEAEKEMFRATGGVNTQKGLLFSLGLTLGATGLLVRDGKPVAPEAVCAILREMTSGLVARELGKADPVTAGEKVYRDFGLSGIRGEMEAGLPSVLKTGLPVLENAFSRGEECNRALLRTLVALMAVVEDTTILSRSPRLESLRMVQEKARALQSSGLLEGEAWKDALWKLDRELVGSNLSPGGSADLLALAWYLFRAQRSGPEK
jgi:triphosphoribosyl-dephospho-CoA synthetase